MLKIANNVGILTCVPICAYVLNNVVNIFANSENMQYNSVLTSISNGHWINFPNMVLGVPKPQKP